jgi:hypothetical protein
MFFVAFKKLERRVSFSITVIQTTSNKHKLKRKGEEIRRKIKYVFSIDAVIRKF